MMMINDAGGNADADDDNLAGSRLCA